MVSSLEDEIKNWGQSWCFTHIAEMPQWLPALSPAESYSDRPMRETVGAMVRGPMKRMRKPIRPEKPTRTWRTEATMMEPCSCGETTYSRSGSDVETSRSSLLFAHSSQAALPHFHKLGGGRVDQAGILGPSRALPVWHGQHGHGRGNQGEGTPL